MKTQMRLLFGYLCGLTALAFSVPTTSATVEEGSGESNPWTNDFEAALAQAGEDGRHLLLNFTGSDWCVWCHRLRDEVFVQEPFLEFASESLVLVEVDFPNKTAQPESLRIQNASLEKRFRVSGFPTIIVLAPDDREIGRLSYMQGGSKTFVRAIKKLIRTDRDRASP